MTTTRPVLFANGSPKILERISIEPGATAKTSGYDEKWLQDLIQGCPALLPTGEIEPGFGQLIPVSTEVSCGHGFIDNLFVTADGGIAIVETKLWRNPEARRLVVAQALDYASALARMSYSEFEKAAIEATFPPGRTRPSSLYSIVAAEAEAVEEAVFIDSVSMNLKRGRMLVLAAGDGIRTETEALADLLQSHAGARFTFALVTIELFRMATGEMLAVPRAIAKTVSIERGVIRIVDGQIVVEAAETKETAATGRASATERVSMTEELFLEAMGSLNPQLPGAVRDFLGRLSTIGVYADWLQSLNLKWRGGPKGTVNLGYIGKNGSVATDATNWMVSPDRALEYQQDLARISGGTLVQKSEVNGPYLAAADGKHSIRIDTLLPAKADEWFAAAKAFVERLEAEEKLRD